MINKKLKVADRIEITVLIDNYTDALLMFSDNVVMRADIPMSKSLLAEHGFSLLVRAYSGDEVQSVLLDTGASKTCLFHNAELLEINLEEIETVVVSHGHFDHFGGLIDFLKSSNKPREVVLHPDAFAYRRLNLPGRPSPIVMATLEQDAIIATRAKLTLSRSAYLPGSGMVMTSGEVERTTDFEKETIFTEILNDGEWRIDPFIDDQGIALNLKDKGLVVISGCAHSGIVNLVKHFQKKTNVDKVHAIMGGFHLSGPAYEAIIDPTVKAMKLIGPSYVVPMHCTGKKAINRFDREMPDQVLVNCVGTKYVFSPDSHL